MTITADAKSDASSRPSAPDFPAVDGCLSVDLTPAGAEDSTNDCGTGTPFRLPAGRERSCAALVPLGGRHPPAHSRSPERRRIRHGATGSR